MRSYECSLVGQNLLWKTIEDPLEVLKEGATSDYLIQELGWGTYAPTDSRVTALGRVRTYGANHTKLFPARLRDSFPYAFLVEIYFSGEAFARIWCEDIQSYIRLHQEVHRVGEWKEWH